MSVSCLFVDNEKHITLKKKMLLFMRMHVSLFEQEMACWLFESSCSEVPRQSDMHMVNPVLGKHVVLFQAPSTCPFLRAQCAMILCNPGADIKIAVSAMHWQRVQHSESNTMHERLRPLLNSKILRNTCASLKSGFGKWSRVLEKYNII